jgi:3(or 17)beta-hydroxysteroid dehydrogenase
MGRVSGKVAIVTGAAGGLGEADARLLAAEGARVVLTDVDAERGERAAAAIGSAARFVRQDVAEEASWPALIAEVLAREGRLDILVNNAGVAEIGDIETTSTAAYRRVMAVSADGTFFGCKYALPALKASGAGSIVNMASIASIQGEATFTAYCAAKGAIEALTRAVAVHCAQSGLPVRCNSVHPAGIDTPMIAEVGRKLAAAAAPADAASAGAHRFNALGRPEDVAYAVLYLASEESRFVNGQRLVVDNTISVTSGKVPVFD